MSCIIVSEYIAGNMLPKMRDKSQWNKGIQNSEICTNKDPSDVLLPWCLNIHEGKQLCNKYKGHMTIITNSELQDKLLLLSKGISDAKGCLNEFHNLVWTGFTDEEVEGNFIDINEGLPMNAMMDLLPFNPSEPNGERAENCVIAWDMEGAQSQYKYDISWYDTTCYRRDIPSFCKIDDNPRIQIRGWSGYLVKNCIRLMTK